MEHRVGTQKLQPPAGHKEGPEEAKGGDKGESFFLGGEVAAAPSIQASSAPIGPTGRACLVPALPFRPAVEVSSHTLAPTPRCLKVPLHPNAVTTG